MPGHSIEELVEKVCPAGAGLPKSAEERKVIFHGLYLGGAPTTDKDEPRLYCPIRGLRDYEPMVTCYHCRRDVHRGKCSYSLRPFRRWVCRTCFDREDDLGVMSSVQESNLVSGLWLCNCQGDWAVLSLASGFNGAPVT